MRCSGCGGEIAPGDTFCQECGIRFAGGRPPRADTGVKPGEPGAGGAGANTGTPTKDTQEAAAPPPEPRAAVPPAPPASHPAAPARPAKRKTSGLAVASLVLGITCFFLVPIIGAILAIIFGALARGRIKRSGGELGGKGMANAGLALGIVGLVVLVLLAAILVPIGIVYVWPQFEARRDLLKGVDAAQTYYFRSAGGYSGMTADALAEIDETVEFRKAPGAGADVVYVRESGARRASLYCYSRTGKRYSASATGVEWRYSFHLADFERERWWEDWDDWVPF